MDVTRTTEEVLARRNRAIAADLTGVMAVVARMVRAELPTAADILICPTGGADLGMDDLGEDPLYDNPRPLPPSPLILTHIRDAAGHVLWADTPDDAADHLAAVDPVMPDRVRDLLAAIEHHALTPAGAVAGWQPQDTPRDRDRVVLVRLPDTHTDTPAEDHEGRPAASTRDPLTLAWGHTLAVVLTALHRQQTFVREIDGEWVEVQPLWLIGFDGDTPPPDLRDARVMVLVLRTGQQTPWTLAELVPDWDADRLRH